jgi:uncharacterized membrane protein HdeD (DUF308 family)
VALAIVVTFSPDHSAPLGYVALGAYAVVAGAMQGWAGLRASGTERMLLVAQGIVLLVTAALAFAFVSGGLPFLVLLLSGSAVVTGALELFAGVRSERPVRRDRIFVGALTLALAAAVLVVPPGLSLPTSGVDGSTGVLTASTIIVGALGAYLAVVGVYLAIAAFSLKWAAAPAAAAGA